MIGFLLTPILLLSPGSNGVASDELLSLAVSEYEAGLAARGDSNQARAHFTKAADAYEQAWDTGKRTPELARNMAQARFLAGDLGRCIRDYRRGLRLAPADLDLRRGLAFARDQVAYPANGDVEKAARAQVTDSPLTRMGVSSTRLAIAATLSWLGGWFFLARAWMTRRGGVALFGIICIALASTLGSAIWWGDHLDREQSSNSTAVVVSGTELRLGNSDEYPRRIDGRLPAGVELRVLGERGGWLHVELADGTAGWLPRDRVAYID